MLKRIMFVCTGNICRSPLAHRILERQARQRGMEHTIQVESSGTDGWHVGENMNREMRNTAKRHGIDMSHRARRLQADDIRTYDLLFAMARNHYHVMQSMGGTALSHKVYMFRQFDCVVENTDKPQILSLADALDVPDPYYGDREDYEEVYRIVIRCCANILHAIEHKQIPM